MDSHPKETSERVHELDGLRGILALWVVAAHIFCWCGWWEINLPLHCQSAWNLFVSGVPPVETFIILSGFAITFYLHQKKQGYLPYLTSRFFRLYPVYLVCLILGIASSRVTPAILGTASWRQTVYFDWIQAHFASQQANYFSHIFWHLTLLNGLIPKTLLVDSTGTFLPPAWSITLEWQFYLVAPLLLLLLRSSMGIVVITVIAFIFSRYSGDWENSQMAFLPGQLPLFLAGIASYHLYSWFKSLEARGTKALVLPVAVMIAAAVLTLNSHSVALMIWALAFGAIFMRGDDLFSRALSLLRTVLNDSSLQLLGKISYPLYLIHWPLILISLRLLLYWRPAISSAEAVLFLIFVSVPMILLAAIVLHKLVEVPGRSLGRLLFAKRTVELEQRSSPKIEFSRLRTVENTTT